MAAPTIALIHGTPAAIVPARDAFTERFPEARLRNVLDDRLIADADAAGGLTPALKDRMATLIGYAVASGADAVLLTCSMYGPATEAGGWPVPVAASDQAMFARLRQDRPARVAVLGPLAAGVADTVARLREFLPGTVVGITVDGGPDRLVAAAERAAPTVDAIVLGQYSVSPAAAAVGAAVPVPVYSPPHLAAQALREVLS